MKEIPRLKAEFDNKIREELKKELKLSNTMTVPIIQKVVLNIGLGEAIDEKGVIEEMTKQLSEITGQKPVETLSKRAISSFKIRKGDVIGLKVTLRGNRMWEFIDKLINVTLPRTRDFRGLPADAFDGQGNYTIGILEQTVFPEIDPNEVTKLRGLEVTFVTSATDDVQAKALLDKFGVPFSQDGKKV